MLLYLAGLTCNEDTGAQKGGFLNTAGEEASPSCFPTRPLAARTFLAKKMIGSLAPVRPDRPN